MKKVFILPAVMIFAVLVFAKTTTAAAGSEGYIEKIDNMTVKGWAYDNGQALDIQVKLQETTSRKIYTIQTNGPFTHRDDVCAYLAHQYAYQSACNPEFGIYFGRDLPGGTFKILSGTFNGKSLKLLPNAKNSYTKPVVGPSIGYIDWVNQGGINGWAYDGGQDVNIELTIRNVSQPQKTYTLTGKPTVFRDDVASFLASEYAITKPTNLNAFYGLSPLSVIKENGKYEIIQAYFNRLDFKFSDQQSRFFDVTAY